MVLKPTIYCTTYQQQFCASGLCRTKLTKVIRSLHLTGYFICIYLRPNIPEQFLPRTLPQYRFLKKGPNTWHRYTWRHFAI
jgi:hypothetical protein